MNIGPRPGGDDDFNEDDVDVIGSTPMGGDDDETGEDWNANDMADPDETDTAEDDDGEEMAASDEDGPEDEDEEDGPEDEDEGEDLEPLDPPATWPDQEKRFFSALPPAMQHAYVARAQAFHRDYTQKTQAIAQERQRLQQQFQHHNELDRVIAPYQEQWALNGMNTAQAVSQLIALSNFATKDAEGFIKYFANLRGIDLQRLTGQEEYVDPQVAALRQPLSQVQAQLNQMQQQWQQGQQAAQQQQYVQAYNSVNASMDQFARQTGQDGRPLYPHFNEVMGEMAALIEAGTATSLPDAYAKAIWVNEGTRAKELARAKSAQNEQNRLRAKQAKRAASSLTGSSGANGAFTGGDLSIREALEAAMAGQI